MRKKALLIDIDYETIGDSAIIKLFLKEKSFFTAYDKNFRPYFYVDTKEQVVPCRIGECQIVAVENVEKLLGNETKMLKKIYCRHPREVVLLREYFSKIGSVYEADIPFAQRYLIDKGLTPANAVDIELAGDFVEEIKSAGEVAPNLTSLCFDIEVYTPQIVPRERVDPIIIISYCDRDGCGAITWGYEGGEGSNVISTADEKSMIEKFCDIVATKDPDLIVGYNSAAFDLYYLLKRAEILGSSLPIGRDKRAPSLKRTGMTMRVDLNGRTHIDIFYTVRLLAAAQALRTQRYTLEEVYRELTGKEKIDLEEECYKIWDDVAQRKRYIEYALSDAAATAELFDLLFPLHIELARLSKLPLREISGITSGQLVESLLTARAAQRGILIPSKPSENEKIKRGREQIAGAYVKMPEPGVYEKIAVLDFRSLYPSLITSFNISPETLNCGHAQCIEKNTLPSGHHFCIKREGFIPSVLKELLEARKIAKAKLTVAKEDEVALLRARVAALKIIANSFYGMLRYAGARWYCREGAESVTALGRQYIQDLGKKAEQSGFGLLYQDTDSLFLLMGGKSEEDVLHFIERINAELPGTMELELEGFYTRGLFVAKKQKIGGAKKKYALIDKAGRIKIRGFELVRRDWSKIARDTQIEVLNAILREGSKERAFEIVRDKIAALREGKVTKEELTIYTQLRKGRYEVTSPEFSAFEKARKRGIKIKIGSIIGYIVTKAGKGISEKAELAQFARDYDAEYYINNQIIPAVLKILGELGYREEDIKYLGRQSTLEGWM